MKDIRYSLRGVTVEQFATLFEPTDNSVEIDVSVPLMANYKGRSFAVGANIQYVEDGKPFLVAEAFCHYEIDESCWEKLSEECTKDVVLPNELIDSLARIAISTVRGIICVKTENTPFAKYFLPIIEFEPTREREGFVISKP